jgi:RNA polymerase sigma factor (sigma-70 family)
MASQPAPPPRSKRPYMMAVVLGTALTAFGGAGEATLQAIADMGRYCTTCWRNARLPADAWTDCTQEVFRRLLERLPADSWQRVLAGDGAERREFLRAIDTVKKRTQRARKWAGDVENVADRHGQHARYLNEQRELVREAAEQLLTPRQQRILQLSFEGWAVHEMAQELKLPVERVSDEKYKAIRKLRAHLAGAGQTC